METVDLIQGTPEWHEHRAKHFNASDAPAMMGVSPYKTRDELLREYKTGIRPEVDAATQKRFDDGHRYEEMARPLAEQMINEDLYPITGIAIIDDLPLSASFDGLTMMEDQSWEHKTINNTYRSCSKAKDLPEYLTIQIDQQQLISGCEKTLFTASSGTKDDKVDIWYKSTKAKRNAIIRGWKQFAKDLEAYEVTAPEVKPVGKQLGKLPVLTVTAVGRIETSNLPAFKDGVSSYIQAINEDLQTDQDFADAEQAVKDLKKGEEQCALMNESVLNQTADIKLVLDTVEELREEMRQKRLYLDKLVKAEKEKRRAEIVGSAEQELRSYIEGLNNQVSPYSVGTHDADFWAEVKGKKTLDSMRNAVNTEIARVKVSLDEHAELIQKNAAHYQETVGGYSFLFRDLQQLVHGDHDIFKLQVKDRIRDHQEEEERKRKAEEERIRAEEQAKARKEAEAKAEAEREKIRQEEAAKVKAEFNNSDPDREQREAAQEQAEEIAPPMAAAKNISQPESANKSPFDTWWNREGIAIPRIEGEHEQNYIRRVAEIAWANGIDTAIHEYSKIKVA